MNVYFISGLGADKRAFKYIKLQSRFNIHHIEWISPLKDESLGEYCIRLSSQIDLKRPFILIGLSFGGIVGVELSKRLKPLKCIIISSVATRDQLPWYYKMIGRTGFHKLVPTSILKSANRFAFWAFSARSQEEKNLLTQILRDTDPIFLRWAINAILTWKNAERPRDLFHIHGTKDKILPIRFVQADKVVKQGGHLMIVSMGDAISALLKVEMENL